MKKVKKLAIVMVAVVALMATTISVSAASSPDDYYNYPKKYFSAGALKSAYTLADYTIYYKNLLSGYGKNIFTFSSVDSRLMEGNVVLSIDFSNPNATTRRERYRKLGDWKYLCEIADYTNNILLMDKNNKYILEGKYPLIVDLYGALDGYVNIMVGTNRLFLENFDITRAYYYLNWGGNQEMDIMSLHYEIDDLHVLPSYKIVLEEVSNSSNRAKFTGELVQNHHGYYTINYGKNLATVTNGNVEFNIPSKYRGKSFYAYVNGVNVGKITLPTSNTGSASFENYGVWR